MKNNSPLTVLMICLLAWGACRFSVPEVVLCRMESDHFLIVFSTEMDRILTEQAFSLTENEIRQEGKFIWSGCSLSFYPHDGIRSNRDYLLSLEKSAEDEYGNSLRLSRSWTFRDGEDRTPPAILSVSPMDHSEITDPRQMIIYKFSESIDIMSFRRAFSINPPLKYSLHWQEEDRELHIQTMEDFLESEEYSLTVSTELSDRAMNTLKQTHETQFSMTERNRLLLDSLMIIRNDVILGTGNRVEDIEKDDLIRGRLSRTADSDERYDLLIIQPEVAMDLSWDSSFREFTVSFPGGLTYGEAYDLWILDKSYKVLCAGIGSIPLHVESLSFSPSEEQNPPRPLQINESLGAYDSETACLEIVLSHSPLSQIDKSSFLRAFSIDSGVLDFDYRFLEIECEADSGLTMIRILMTVSDSSLPGTVRFSLNNILADTLGNSLGQAWALTVNQP